MNKKLFWGKGKIYNIKMKDKRRLIIGIVIVICIIGVVFFLRKPQIQLKSTEFWYEYGEHISTHIEDYLVMDHFAESQKKAILSQSKMEISISNEDKKDYPKVGEYSGVILLGTEELHFKVIVKDTKPPQFEDFEETIETAIGVKPNYDKFFMAHDLSAVTIQYDDQNVNYDIPGEYIVDIRAVDEYKNKTVKEVGVKVVQVLKEDYVMIKKYIPNIYIDLRYASSNNFTQKIIYNFQNAYLRYGTVQKLKKVQDELWELGYSLKIWDAYRPFSAQKKLWEVVNNPRYVANPSKGPKSHNLGGTVDITLVKKDGSEIPMPTQFDDFSLRADRNYSDISNQDAVSHVKLLENTMYKYGFTGYKNEWWDYTDTVTYSFVDFQPNH